jgi:hypothetical protein
MRPSSNVNIHVLGLAAVAAIGIGCRAFVSNTGNYPDEKKDVYILLAQQNPSAPCLPADPEQLRRKTKNDITWHIRNTCSTPQWVKIDSFREKNVDGKGTPGPIETILEPAAPTTGPVPELRNGVEGTADLPATITKDYSTHPNPQKKKEFEYKYVISIGPDGQQWPTRLDPDIDIWP